MGLDHFSKREQHQPTCKSRLSHSGNEVSKKTVLKNGPLAKQKRKLSRCNEFFLKSTTIPCRFCTLQISSSKL